MLLYHPLLNILNDLLEIALLIYDVVLTYDVLQIIQDLLNLISRAKRLGYWIY